ncbi:MAG: efflux RND transporter periplasmic adaptor subunit [Prolixibacteraceae bacterium]
MKKIINILVVVAVIAAIVLVLKRNKKSNQEKTAIATVVSTAVQVQIEAVKEGTFNLGFSSNGVLEPLKSLSFVSNVAGRVESIKVKKGIRVNQGQNLIQVDDEMLKSDYKSSEAAYNSLKKDYERFKNASEAGGVSKQQLDNIQTQMIAAESRYLSSKRRFEDATIQAPISGFINERYVEVGAYLNPGTRLFDIVDDSKLKIQCSVSEQQVLRLKKGQKANLTCNALPGVELSGTISFIGAVADRGLNFPIEVLIDDKKELKAGMYVTTFFESQSESKGILIPRNAVSGSVKSANVFVVNKGIASKRDVIIGAMVNEDVEIISGLQVGDSIVTAGLINVSDGVKVTNKN